MINSNIKKTTEIDVENKKNNQLELAKIDTENLLKIFSILEEIVGEKKFKDSSIRGKLRGYMPLTKINGHLKMEKIEVPLVRLIALLKTWTSEMNLLSGYNNKSNSGRKFSIDLAKKHKKVLKLAEVKEWEGSDALIYAVIEIISNFFIYLIMRKKESNIKNRWVPECKKFQLEIIAPTKYYCNQNIHNYTEINKKINKSLSEAMQQLKSRYSVDHIKFAFREVAIDNDKLGLKKIMEEVPGLLTNKYLDGKPTKKVRQQLANKFNLSIQNVK